MARFNKNVSSRVLLVKLMKTDIDTDNSNPSINPLYYRRLNTLRIKLGILLVLTIVLGLGSVAFHYKIPIGVTIARYILHGISIPAGIYLIFKLLQKDFEAENELREQFGPVVAHYFNNPFPSLPYALGFIILLAANYMIASNALFFDFFAFFSVIAVIFMAMRLYNLRKQIKEIVELTRA